MIIQFEVVKEDGEKVSFEVKIPQAPTNPFTPKETKIVFENGRFKENYKFANLEGWFMQGKLAVAKDKNGWMRLFCGAHRPLLETPYDCSNYEWLDEDIRNPPEEPDEIKRIDIPFYFNPTPAAPQENSPNDDDPRENDVEMGNNIPPGLGNNVASEEDSSPLRILNVNLGNKSNTQVSTVQQPVTQLSEVQEEVEPEIPQVSEPETQRVDFETPVSLPTVEPKAV